MKPIFFILKYNLFIVLFITVSCDFYSTNKSDQTEQDDNTITDTLKNQVSSDCLGMPNCDDKDGLLIHWHPGTTREIIQRPEFLKQIPKNYNGKLKLCGENGLYRLLSCKNGKVDGICYEYDCDWGYDEQYYKNSIAEGTWISYDQNGKYFFVRNFRNGKLHGKMSFFDKDNKYQLLTEENYVNGELDGICKKYFNSGRVQESKKYNRGVIENSKTYYENGQLECEINYRGSPKIKYYDQQGNVIGGTIEQDPIKIHRP